MRRSSVSMDTVMAHSVSYKLAKLVRVLTVPPIMALVLVLILASVRPESFLRLSGPWFMILFLTILPVLSYPLSHLIPSIKKAGRDGQRNLAFILSGVGYVCGFLYGLLGPCSKTELMVYGIYLISVLLLLLFNKLLKIRASGHACSAAGPLVLCFLFLGIGGAIAGISAAAAIVWSSVKLKRHTVKELLLGAMLCVTAGILSYYLTCLFC